MVELVSPHCSRGPLSRSHRRRESVHDAVVRRAQRVASRLARNLELFGRSYFAHRLGGGARPKRAGTGGQEGERAAQRVITQHKEAFRRATLSARARHL